MWKKLLAVISILSIATVSLLAVGYFQLQKYMDTPLQISKAQMEYVLARGSSLSSLAHSLAKQDVLTNPRWLIAYGRLSGAGINVKAGEYIFSSGLTPRQLLDKVERGEVRQYQVTLVEGWTIEQSHALLQKQGKLKKQLGDAWKDEMVSTLDINISEFPTLEGLFFPDTYSYHSELGDKDLLKQAYERLRSVLADEWEKREDSLPYKNEYEALIMASLIEKETGEPSERPQIAGVFVRRLQKGMRLQTDPTVIYGLGAGFNGNLRSRHLKDPSNPYNTYRHHGLPPTPIALVGREAINAALHPEEGNTFYFVAKGDGTHYFSETLEEHQKAVRKYQIYGRRKNYSSAPQAKKTRAN